MNNLWVHEYVSMTSADIQLYMQFSNFFTQNVADISDLHRSKRLFPMAVYVSYPFVLFFVFLKTIFTSVWLESA